MHSYLRAVGFSTIKQNTEVISVINAVKENPTSTIEVMADNTIYVEFIREVGDGIGLVICGEKDDNNEFILDHYYPYIIGSEVSSNEDVYLSKRIENDSYTGMCDDYRVGVSLIFYLSNAIEYLSLKKRPDKTDSANITLAALSTGGKILLPTDSIKKVRKVSIDKKQRSQLLAEAKNGNQEAIESLTLDEIDLYAKVSNRVRREDIFSIVDTSFIPFGSESDIYSVTGIIVNVRQIVNRISEENLYIMTLNCNGLLFDVCINSTDLMGEPAKGRRFRGTVWMQGRVDFTENI